MHQSVLENFTSFSIPLEGKVSSMYCDILGLITTAIGCLIDPEPLALALPWHHEKTGHLATPAEISAAWRALKSEKDKYAKLHWKYAAQLNDLRLDELAIESVVTRRLLANETILRKTLHGWDEYPADAQLACCSIAWACGAGFTQTFKNFTRACIAQDWIAAKASCTIRETGNPGVVPRNTANRRCLESAITVKEHELDPSILFWPNPAAWLPSASDASSQSVVRATDAEIRAEAARLLAAYPFHRQSLTAAISEDQDDDDFEPEDPNVA